MNKHGNVLVFDEDFFFNASNDFEEEDQVENITTDDGKRKPEREVKWKILKDDKEDDVHLQNWSNPQGGEVYYQLDYSQFETYVEYVLQNLKSSDSDDNIEASAASGTTSSSSSSSSSVKYSHPSAQIATKMRASVPKTNPKTVILF